MEEEKRTITQNKAMHKYFELLANELNSAGLSMQKTLKPEIDIDWTPEMIKKYLWKPVQNTMYSKLSTTKLNTKEVSQIYETLNRLTAQKFGISVAFPSNEEPMI